MKKNIDLSVIIVSFNTRKLLDDCLASIFKNLVNVSITFEVIVVDNASTDESVDLVKKKYPLVRLIKNTTNVGFGKANNQGVSGATGETILFLNSDVVVIDGAISRLWQFFNTLPDSAVAGGKLFNPDRSAQPSCGPAYSLPNIFIALFLKGDYLHITRYSPDTVKEVDWVMGACVMVRKNEFLKVGKFDEGIFMYMEEIDFEYRAKQLGMKIYFYPDAHFIHVGHASSSGRATPILNVFRGFIYFYNKHGNYVQNIILRTILILKSVSAILMYLLLGKKYDRDLYIKAFKLVI